MFFCIRIFICPHSHKPDRPYWTKVVRKKIFFEGYSPILKYRSHRSYTKFLEQNFYRYVTVCLVRIWTYKNMDKKAHTFSLTCKNVKKWILRKLTLKLDMCLEAEYLCY